MPQRNRDPFSAVRAVAFDVDNTLVDIHEVKRRTFKAVGNLLESHGVRPKDSPHADALLEWAIKHGIDASDIVPRYLEEHIGRARDDEVAREAVRMGKEAEARHATLYPGALEVLETLGDRGYRLLGVTDAPREASLRRLENTNLGDPFEFVVAREDTPDGKNTVAPWRVALERTGLEPQAVACVGDHPVKDVARPMSLGCLGILALHGERSGFNTVEGKPPATAVISRLAELGELLGDPPTE